MENLCSDRRMASSARFFSVMFFATHAIKARSKVTKAQIARGLEKKMEKIRPREQRISMRTGTKPPAVFFLTLFRITFSESSFTLATKSFPHMGGSLAKQG